MEALGEASLGETRLRGVRRTRGTSRRGPTGHAQGHIETRPGGSARVKLYAGQDALTGRSLYLTDAVPAGPDLEARAEAARAALVGKVAKGEHPRTDATIDELMEWHLATAKLGRKTRHSYLGYHRKHIRPLLGKVKINGVLDEDPDLLEIFYDELARCRDHCSGKPTVVKHGSPLAHQCAGRCQWHECQPLSDWTIRKIHWMLHGADASARRPGNTWSRPLVVHHENRRRPARDRPRQPRQQ